MNDICVFDVETDSKIKEFCGITQIACLMIHPYKLEVIPGSEFYSKVRPADFDNEDYLTTHGRKDTIDFHCKNRKISQEELLAEWDKSPQTDVVLKEFSSHINKYNRGTSNFTAPYPAGINIVNFDIPIMNRLCEKYKIKDMFGWETIDLRHLNFFWLIWKEKEIRSRSMDSLRDYMGMPKTDAHNALVDVRQEAQMIIKYLKLHKELSPRIQFKDCFKEELV